MSIAVHGNPSQSYGITQCYLPPTQVNAPCLNPSKTGRYSIYLPRRDGRLSWPRCLVTYLSCSHILLSCSQTVAHPSSNRALHKAKIVIETIAYHWCIFLHSLRRTVLYVLSSRAQQMKQLVLTHVQKTANQMRVTVTVPRLLNSLQGETYCAYCEVAFWQLLQLMNIVLITMNSLILQLWLGGVRLADSLSWGHVVDSRPFQCYVTTLWLSCLHTFCLCHRTACMIWYWLMDVDTVQVCCVYDCVTCIGHFVLVVTLLGVSEKLSQFSAEIDDH